MQALQRQLRPLVLALALFLCIAGSLVLTHELLPEDLALTERDTWMGLAGILVGGFIVAVLGSRSLRGLIGGTWLQACGKYIQLLLGAGQPLQIIENGVTVLPEKSDGPLMGPRMVILRGTAAVLYRGARQTRIEGPGVVWTHVWEYVQSAHNLRPRKQTFVFDPVLTRDRIPVSVELAATYGVRLPDEIIQGTRPMTEPERRLIARLDLASPDHRAEVQAVLEQELRRAVVRQTYEHLLTPVALRRLGEDVFSQANAQLNPRGLNVLNVTPTRLTPTREMMAAASQAQAELTLEISRAAAWRDALHLLADGYTGAKGTDWMSDDDIKREVLRRVLDTLARQPKDANSAISASAVQALMNGPIIGPLSGIALSASGEPARQGSTTSGQRPGGHSGEHA